jgi:hypothetical protein
VQAARDREQRRKKAEKTRVEKEEKEKETRKQLGIGLATQLAGYSLTQKQMKGGMEGWLGVGGAGKKRKRDEDVAVEEKENRGEGGSADGGVVEKRKKNEEVEEEINESFGSNMSLDEAFLGQLDSTGGETITTTTAEAREDTLAEQSTKKEGEPTEISSDITRDCYKKRSSNQLESGRSNTPPAKRTRMMSSPNDSWAQFLDGNSQILQDISSSSPRPELPGASSTLLPHMSTQDLEITSDDLFETGLPKTTNPAISPREGVIVRDFAYFKSTDGGSFTLKVPGAPSLPRKSRTEASLRRSFGRRPMLAMPSPKMTATCSTFTAAQCSFTSDYHHYGLSTQLLQQALDDGDDDTEDEDEEVYSQALEASKIPDKVLMPPPPLRLSPKVFKPPAENDLFAGKGGLHILGLSTQVLNDALSASDDDELTDEDEDDGLFNIPIKRPATSETAEPSAHANTSTETTEHASSDAASNTKKPGFRDFGLSTQVLQDAALDDIDFTDDEDTQGS